MGWCKSGKCGHLGSGGFIIWEILDAQEDYSFEELFPMAVIGEIGGLLRALFNQLTLYITYCRRNYLHKKGNRVKGIQKKSVRLRRTEKAVVARHEMVMQSLGLL